MEWVLTADPSSAGAARQLVVDALRGMQKDACADVAELLVSELVTNALLHARTDVRVRVDTVEDRVRVEVLDASPVNVRLRHFSADSTTGRGLALVEALASRWGSDLHAGSGKCVWFELDPAGAA